MRAPSRVTRLSVLAMLFAMLIAVPAGATLSEALSLDELVARADHVVLATATDRRAQRDARNRIVTDYELRVEDVMKGDAAVGSTLTMRSFGGAIGDIGMRIEGEPHLTVGQRYVVFLARSANGNLRPVGMSQGVLPVQGSGPSTQVMPGGAGLHLVEPEPGGQLAPAPGAILHPLPYAELRQRVATAIDRTVTE